MRSITTRNWPDCENSMTRMRFAAILHPGSPRAYFVFTKAAFNATPASTPPAWHSYSVRLLKVARL